MFKVMFFPWSPEFVGFYSFFVPSARGYWQIPTNLDTRITAEDPITQGDVQQNNATSVRF